MKITGGIVTYNNAETIEKCISTILDVTNRGSGKKNRDVDYIFRLYVYDNGSSDGTADLVESKFPEVTVIRSSENKGFGAGHNAIIKSVQSDYHFVINPDIHLDMDTFAGLVQYMESDNLAGLVTPKILNNDGTEQYLPKYCPTIRYAFISKLPGFHYLRRRYTRQAEEFTEPTEIKFCTGCFFGVKTAYIKELRGFSNRFFMYCEDTDLSRRVMADGKKIVFCPEVTAYHDWHRENTGNIRGIFRFIRSLITYYNKWGWEF